jgi:hypothetical protein
VLRRARLFFPSPTPHLDSNRRATEPEGVADLVHKKPFVGKMEGRRYVREEHEGGRRDTRLCRIEHAHLFPPGAGRRVHGRDGLNESIELWCRHAFLTSVGHPVDRLQQLRGALPGGRRDMQYRSVVEKLQLPAQLLVEHP